MSCNLLFCLVSFGSIFDLLNMNTPRILHIITGLSTGGAERALYNLLNGGLAKYFNTHIISLSNEGTIGPQIKALGVPVTSLGIRGGLPNISALLKLRRIVKEFRPALIQGWMYHGNLAATMACALSQGCPALAWNIRHCLYDLGHEKLVTRQVIRANRFFSSAPAALLYNSCLSRKHHENFGFASSNGRVIPNGTDEQEFRFSDESCKRVRRELGIPTTSQVVGHVARLHPMKDHPRFLRAAAVIALRYPELHFLLSGRDVSQENKALVQLLPASVHDRFHLLGERRDVSELMAAMDVFCQSSWSEGFPNVLGEAMATGVACVATDVGDSSIIIGDTGVVIPPRDEKALIGGIESILKMPPEVRCQMSVRARTRIEENYSLGSVVKRYAALYKKLIPINGAS